jgi:hypothetical protein
MASQLGVALVGLALSIGPGGVGALLAFSAIALTGMAYLGMSHVSEWASQRPPATDSSTRWAFRLLMITAWLDLSIVLTSPMGLLGVGLAYMDNPQGIADLAVLMALLLWLTLLAGLKLVAWRMFTSGDPRARWLAQGVVGCTALGAGLPWTSWLRAIPLCAALAIEAALVVSGQLGSSRRRTGQADPDLRTGV